MLSKAIEIANRAHAGQTDKGGKPYILHPITVMMSCEKDDEKICAILHDVVEDTPITFDELKKEGFSDEIVAALDCLTRRTDESYGAFIDRVITNPLACKVKLADLIDNMDLSRLKNPTQEDQDRVKKYRLAADRISDVLPYVDEIPDYKLIEINGCVEVQPYISVDMFSDRFINFIETNGWFFGGGYQEVEKEEAKEN